MLFAWCCHLQVDGAGGEEQLHEGDQQALQAALQKLHQRLLLPDAGLQDSQRAMLARL
jgi:hypothetical protein